MWELKDNIYHLLSTTNVVPFLYGHYRRTVNPYHPQILQNPPRGIFLGENQHWWKLVLLPLQMGQNYYLARSTGRMKDQWKCMVHFKDKGMFPKVHWRILEDSGRFLARILGRLGLLMNILTTNCWNHSDIRFAKKTEFQEKHVILD